MKIKPFFVILIIYIIIFGAIFIMFAYRDGKAPSGEQNVLKAIGESFKDLFGDIAGIFKSIKIGSPFKDRKPLFSRCKFEEDFDCLNHLADKPSKSILLNLKSRINVRIVVYEVTVFEGIVCNISEEKQLRPYDEFYIKLENCEFNDIQGKIKIKYYKYGSSELFGKTAEGTLVLKD